MLCQTGAVLVSRARYLVSPRGREALASLAPELGRLDANRLAAALRRSFEPEEASALAEQVTLQLKARERFGSDPGYLYTAEGLEMMTHPLVAELKQLDVNALTPLAALNVLYELQQWAAREG